MADLVLMTYVGLASLSLLVCCLTRKFCQIRQEILEESEITYVQYTALPSAPPFEEGENPTIV